MSESNRHDHHRDPNVPPDPDDGSVVHIPGPLPEEIVITFAFSGERAPSPSSGPGSCSKWPGRSAPRREEDDESDDGRGRLAAAGGDE